MRIPAGSRGADRTPVELEPSYDVAILGGGPAGFAAAVSVRSRLDLRVLVAEAQAPGQLRVGESCPPDIILPLGRLGLATVFRESGHALCPGYASSWGRSHVGYNDFIVNPLGPGWRLDRRVFDRMLAAAAAAHGAQVVWRTRFRRVEPPTASRTGYRLHFSGPGDAPPSTTATFVIDSTGPQAHFARALGIRKRIDDRLFAKVQFARVASGDHMTQQVMLEATPQGWWYAAALPGRRVVSMLVGEEDVVRTLGQDEGAAYVRALGATSFVGPALAKLTLDRMRYRTVPIHSGILAQMEGASWLAVGDAASSYDPIMAQGIHKALSDGIAAGEAVSARFDCGGQGNRSYARHVEDRHRRYLQTRADVYRLEQRWPDAPFWRNRHRIEARRPARS